MAVAGISATSQIRIMLPGAEQSDDFEEGVAHFVEKRPALGA
ncbi:hypothetical protein [uncultured Phenylobacterium sp.]|nr:hypothetical protein [uncultured Phenylobacterium sp.]